MLRKKKLYDQAIALRRKGYSYTEILEHVPVGNGTISRWCSPISLTNAQKVRLKEKQRNTCLIVKLREGAEFDKASARAWAQSAVDALELASLVDTIMLTGILLYWAEGTKLNEQGYNGVEFTNTDPRIIRLIMRFFREALHVPEEKLRIIVRIGEKGNVQKAERFWSDITGVPLNNFRKSERLILKPKSKSLQKYPHGMCRVFVNSVSFARKIDNLIPELYKKLETNKVIGPKECIMPS